MEDGDKQAEDHPGGPEAQEQRYVVGSGAAARRRACPDIQAPSRHTAWGAAMQWVDSTRLCMTSSQAGWRRHVKGHCCSSAAPVG